MPFRLSRLRHAALAAAVLACACAPRAGTPATAAPARRAHPADAAFVRGMIAHHAQALRMAALVPARTEAADLRLLAERIDVSQRDEIARMDGWLRARGEEPASDPHAGHHASGAPAMPGMLTDAQFGELEAASGAAFERLFLERMIAHHEGALVMVRELFATDGAAQDAELSALARDVNADQAAEIARMRALAARR